MTTPGHDDGERRLVADPPRPSWELLRDRAYGPFWAGRVLTTIGMWAYSLTAAIVVFDLTGSALFVGLVSAGQFMPQYVLSAWSGARSDRHGERRVQAAAGIAFAAAGAMALVVWMLVAELEGTGGAVIVIAATVATGIGYSVASPPLQALVPALVRPHELSRAIALNSLTVLIGRAAGPAIGAGVTALGSPEAGFAMAVVTNFVFSVILLRTRLREVPSVRQRDDGTLQAAVRHIRLDPALTGGMVGVAAVGIGSDPVLTLTPALAQSFGAASSLAGVLAALFGAGSALAFLRLNAAIRDQGAATVGATGLALLAVGNAAVAASPTPWLAALAMLVGGTGLTFGLTAFTTLIQERVPEDLRGRVMAVWTLAWVGPRPLAASGSGALADATTVQVAVLVVAAYVALSAWVARPARTEVPVPARVPTS